MKGMANGLMCNEEYSFWTVRIRSLTRCCTNPEAFQPCTRPLPQGLDEFTPKAPELDEKNSLALAIAPSAPSSNEAAVADKTLHCRNSMAVMSQEQAFLVWQQQQQSNMVGHDPANPSWESL
uniref:Uncharacterized protein n=1 Tax=Populus trichocarpa TaxID=3694 RepID=B9IM81_POPTR